LGNSFPKGREKEWLGGNTKGACDRDPKRKQREKGEKAQLERGGTNTLSRTKKTPLFMGLCEGKGKKKRALGRGKIVRPQTNQRRNGGGGGGKIMCLGGGKGSK